MTASRFEIVFQKLAGCTPVGAGARTDQTWIARGEIDELDELRRLALEIAEPEPLSHTTT